MHAAHGFFLGVQGTDCTADKVHWNFEGVPLATPIIAILAIFVNFHDFLVVVHAGRSILPIFGDNISHFIGIKATPK